MTKHIAVIRGDGIGVDVIDAGLQVLDALKARFNLDIAYQSFPWNADFYLEHKHMASDDEIAALQRDFDAIYFGAIGDPRLPNMEHGRELLLKLRQSLDLYVNYRPVRTIDPQYSPLRTELAEGIDIAVFRENTQDLYCQVGGSVLYEGEVDVATDSSVYTAGAVKRIIRYAFEWASNNGRKHVDLVDKANAIPNTGRLWRNHFAQIAAEYPNLTTAVHYVDSYCQKMVEAPRSIDVVVTSNLFGDILADLGAGITGGLGLAESANLNPNNAFGLFEPVHGSAPDIAGNGTANPSAAFYTLSVMLAFLGFDEAADRLQNTLDNCLKNPALDTPPDLGGKLTTTEFTQQIIDALG